MARFFEAAGSERIGTGAAMVAGPPFTVHCHFFPVSLNARMLFAMRNQSNFASHTLLMRASDVGHQLAVGSEQANGTAGQSIATAPALNEWHTGGGVWAATNHRVCWLDGTPATPNTTNVNPTGLNSSTIGAYPILGTIPMDGAIAELGVWSAALTDDEMMALQEGVCPLLVRPESLVSYLPLIRGPAHDLIVSPNDGRSWVETGTLSDFPHPRVFYRARQSRVFVSTAGGPPQGAVTAAAALPSLATSGALTAHARAQGATQIPTITADAAATVLVHASGGASLPMLTAASDVSVSDRAHAGGSAVLPVLSVGGAATVLVQADGAATLPVLDPWGLTSSDETAAAAGGAALPILGVAGAATARAGAVGSVVIPQLAAAGAATSSPAAVALAPLPMLVISGSQIWVRAELSGEALLPILTATGTTAPLHVERHVAEHMIRRTQRADHHITRRHAADHYLD